MKNQRMTDTFHLDIKIETLATHAHVEEALITGNLRRRSFRGDGDRTGRESLEQRQPSLPVKNRTLRWQ